MKIEDLDSETLQKMYSQIRQTKEYQKLDTQRRQLVMSGQYTQAMMLSKRIKQIEQSCINQWLEHWNGEVRKVNELTASMSEEDVERMNVYGNSLVFMSDMIETFSIEMNELLKKYHPTFRIETFDKLKELAKEARTHVRMLDAYQDDEFYTNTYGTCVDNLRDMVYNKVKSFIGKIKKNEERTNKKAARNAKVA